MKHLGERATVAQRGAMPYAKHGVAVSAEKILEER
jgi:hypothetical protein